MTEEIVLNEHELAPARFYGNSLNKARNVALSELVEASKKVLILHGWTPEDLRRRMRVGRSYGEFNPRTDSRTAETFSGLLCEEAADIVNYYGMRGARIAALKAAEAADPSEVGP